MTYTVLGGALNSAQSNPIVINFLHPPESNQPEPWTWNKYSICRWQLQLTDTVCLPNKLVIFQINAAQYPVRAWVAVVYFMEKSCYV